MKTKQLRLTKERMTRQALEHGQPEATIAVDLQNLQRWEDLAMAHAQRCRAINENPDLTPTGRAKQIEAEVAKMARQLAGEEATLDAIQRGITAIDGDIVNAVSKALGRNRVQDSTALLLDHLQMQEVRQLWRHQQAQAEADHAARLKSQSQYKLAISDEERQPPNVIKAAFMAACRDFRSDDADIQGINRLLVTAALKSPVPLLPKEIVDQGMGLLKANVCREQLQAKEAAVVRADCVVTMIRSLEDVVRNPLSLAAFNEQHVPLSDQERMAA